MRRFARQGLKHSILSLIATVYTFQSSSFSQVYSVSQNNLANKSDESTFKIQDVKLLESDSMPDSFQTTEAECTASPYQIPGQADKEMIVV